jgi:hypothetical protein
MSMSTVRTPRRLELLDDWYDLFGETVIGFAVMSMVIALIAIAVGYTISGDWSLEPAADRPDRPD